MEALVCTHLHLACRWYWIRRIVSWRWFQLRDQVLVETFMRLRFIYHVLLCIIQAILRFYMIDIGLPLVTLLDVGLGKVICNSKTNERLYKDKYSYRKTPVDESSSLFDCGELFEGTRNQRTTMTKMKSI